MPFKWKMVRRGGGGRKTQKGIQNSSVQKWPFNTYGRKILCCFALRERSKMIKSHSNCPRCLSDLTFTRCCTIHGSYGVHNKWLLFMKYCFGHRGQGSKGCFIQGNKDCSRRSDTQSPLVFPPDDLNWSPPSEQCVYDPNTWNRLKDIRCASLLCMSSHSFCRAAECSSGTMGSRKL